MTWTSDDVADLHHRSIAAIKSVLPRTEAGGVGSVLWGMRDGDAVGKIAEPLDAGEDRKKEVYCLAVRKTLRAFECNGYVMLSEAWLSRPDPLRRTESGDFIPARLDPAREEVVMITTVYPHLRKLLTVLQYNSKAGTVGDVLVEMDNAKEPGAVSGRMTEILDDA